MRPYNNGDLNGSLNGTAKRAEDLSDSEFDALVAVQRGKIENPFDYPYMEWQRELWQRFGLLKCLVENVEVKGMENLDGARPRLYVANHLSQADYAVAIHSFFDNQVRIPHFIAGTNLEHPRILGGMGMDFRRNGAYFVDRTWLNNGASGREKLAFLTALRNLVGDTFDRGEDLWVFPEGGRNYEQSPPKDFKKQIFKLVTNSSIDSDNPVVDSDNLDIVCAAIYWAPERPEERAFHYLSQWRGCSSYSERIKYYGADAFTFAGRLLQGATRGIIDFGFPSVACHMQFGRPKNVREVVEQGGANIQDHNSWRVLRDHAQQEVEHLYNQIYERTGR